MSDVCFDLNYMHTLLGDGYKAENEVSESVYNFEKVTQKMESELSSFSGEGIKAIRGIQSSIFEIKDLISDVDRKIVNAKKQKQEEIKPPSKPSVPANATKEQANAVMSAYHDKVSQVDAQNAEIRAKNQRIDEYVSRCEGAKYELEAIISQLHQLEDSIKSEIDLAVSRVHEAIGPAKDAVNQGSRASKAMGEYNYAFKSTYEDAEKLYMLEPTKISYSMSIDRIFEIRNNHSHMSTGGFSFSSFGMQPGGGAFSSSSNTASSSAYTATSTSSEEELLVRDRDEATFFAKISGISKIKMPSSSVHKLGGKRFNDKMSALGYSAVLQPDGSKIDINGLIHWEKK